METASPSAAPARQKLPRDCSRFPICLIPIKDGHGIAHRDADWLIMRRLRAGGGRHGASRAWLAFFQASRGSCVALRCVGNWAGTGAGKSDLSAQAKRGEIWSQVRDFSCQPAKLAPGEGAGREPPPFRTSTALYGLVLVVRQLNSTSMILPGSWTFTWHGMLLLSGWPEALKGMYVSPEQYSLDGP